MKQLPLFIAFFLFLSSLGAQRLHVSENQRFLVTENQEPFFWMGDTAWELFHRCNREEAEYYLTKRKSQGFTVIHAVALAEIDGLNDPNPYGHRPLFENDPTRPNGKYFEHVDFILDLADDLGLYIALLPSWGDKVFKHNWGVGPEIFTVSNAKVFGNWIGNRYKNRDNIIWVIGGDRNPREGSEDVEIWRSMAAGITAAVGGKDKVLMTFHPQPKPEGGSSTWFHQDDWLDFNMHQTGHCANQPTHEHITHDYQLLPFKPVLDGEPLYEDHPNCFNAKELGHSIPEDIRRIMYWNVFAGAFGQSYGCHAVWQMFKDGRSPINQPLRPWKEALDLPMARQVQHLKHLMLSRPFLTRIPDQSMIRKQHSDYKDYVSATRDSEGNYAMIYFPTGKTTFLDLSSFKKAKLRGWWYDPRTGASFESPLMSSTIQEISPPSEGLGHDWVLVIDQASGNFPPPGLLQGN